MIIIDTKKPDNCAECPFHKEGIAKTICGFTDNGVGIAVSCYERMKDCPIKCDVEDIRAEINEKRDLLVVLGNEQGANGLDYAMMIINEHIGGRE